MKFLIYTLSLLGLFLNINAEYIYKQNVKGSIDFEKKQIFKSCKEILANNNNATSGTYAIAFYNQETINVYCDMETDGGGWTLVAWNKGITAKNDIPANFLTTKVKEELISNPTAINASSLNPELFSIENNTQDAMLKAPYYKTTPIIDNNTGNWNYNNKDCSGYLGHTSRTQGCSNHEGNDNYNTLDAYNIAIYDTPGVNVSKSIVPSYRHIRSSELCWSGGGICDFEFYLR